MPSLMLLTASASNNNNYHLLDTFIMYIYPLCTLSHLLFPTTIKRVNICTCVYTNACRYRSRHVICVNNSNLLSDCYKTFDKSLNPWKKANLDSLIYHMKYQYSYKNCIMYQPSHISIWHFDWIFIFEKKFYLFSCSFLHFNIKYDSIREGSTISWRTKL